MNDSPDKDGVPGDRLPVDRDRVADRHRARRALVGDDAQASALAEEDDGVTNATEPRRRTRELDKGPAHARRPRLTVRLGEIRLGEARRTERGAPGKLPPAPRTSHEGTLR